MPARVITEMCVGCGKCAPTCSQDAITVKVEGAVVEPEKCIDCEECIFTCLKGAITAE